MLMRKPVKNLEVLVNRLLSMDEEGRAALCGLAGSTMSVVLDDTRYRLFLRITDEGLELHDDPEPEADVTIRGTPAAFLGFVRGEKAAAGGSIDISGDVALAQEFQAVLKNLELDWEESLSGLIGDTLARKAGNLIRGTARFMAQTRRTLEADISEYLRYETEVLPDRAEIDEFNSAVDTLRNDVERLKIRIARLQQVRGR
jgi:ubiquinone biosynthesis protein UbiJ